MNNGVKNGLLAALVTTIVFLVIHFLINPRYNFYVIQGMLILGIIYLFFMIRAGLQDRKKMGGSLGFGEAFLSGMTVYGIATFLGTIFTVLVIKYLPGLEAIAIEESLKQSSDILRIFGMEEEAVLEAQEQLVTQTEEGNQFGFGPTLLQWIGTLFFPGLFYGIIAALVAKKQASA